MDPKIPPTIPMTGEFNFTRLEKVAFGPGNAASLGHELERRKLNRALIVTGKTLGRSKLLDKVTAAAGSRLAGVFKGASQHVPSHTVAALVEEYQRTGADCMVSFGGGSPIDTVKVAAKRILEGSRPGGAAPHTIDFEAADVVGGPDLIHIAMPTTLSAGEFTPIGGVTDESSHVKGGVVDPRLAPRTIILDPELTVETPAWLWTATGMRAMDHAVEVIYSSRHQLIADTLGGARDFAAAQSSAGLAQDHRRRIAGASRTMPARGVVLDLRHHEHARRHFARTGPSDRPDVGRAARGHLVHHAAARDAVHGGRRAGALWADR